ncbi:Polygalacturonase ADPG1 [Cardamine amara subsp. amara]|uniref:endo-polygalacturonase n=1 Tax=Cardamine amara subsp. amara TaxID=228776 RepID=A0ABD1C7A4_CARAN
MARCCELLAVLLCFLLMLSWCEALSSNVDDGYGHEDGSFESDSLIKLNNEDILRLKSSDDDTVNVLNFGAKGDGKTDDTQAFKKAWKKACSTNGVTNFFVPKGKTFLLKSTRFKGPCKSLRNFQIRGTLSASTKRSDYKDKNHWLLLEDVNNLSVDGGSTGIINGNGKIWWQNSCKIDKSKPCTTAPTALTLYNLKNLNVKNLRVKNAQQIQISIEKCNNVVVSNVVITAPGDSPNTDGIHITNTQNIRVSKSDIGTGDDCISIEDGTQNLQIYDLTCGPGHGISIGSLGDDNSKSYVSGINVDGAKFSGSDNGVRIKTYQGGSGTAKNIKFQNIRMENVKNPIIIDQNYCDKDTCEEQESAVQVKNVLYKNISGTSATNVAITFNCSEKYPCQEIVLENVNIKGGSASCKNVNVNERGTVSPKCS